MSRPTFLGALCALSIAVVPARAADVSVHPGESLQAAIDAAVDGDRLLLLPGTWSEPIDFHGKSIEVIGLAGADQTILDGSAGAPVVRFASGETTASRLAGVTVRGGHASNGAGGVAVASGATPTLEDCVVRDNSGKFGGGITGSPVMRRCLVLNNTASLTHGGGIYGAPQMSECVVADNTATSASGGGLYVPSGSAVISDTVFVRNHAVFAGSKAGGVYVKSGASASFARCVFAQNSATGGVFAGSGGGLLTGSADVQLVGCTVYANTLTGSSTVGGGVQGPATLVDTIVRGNTEPQLSGVASVTFSDVEGGAAGVGNFDADPLFVDVDALDLHLLAGSPCIDAGDRALVDPDGSRADVGAFAAGTLVTHVATLPADFANPGFASVSAQLGGVQRLEILAGPAHAGAFYLTLGSVSGTAPGLDLLGQHVPLQPDAYFWFTVSDPNTTLLASSLGVLDAAGRAESTFHLPPSLPGVAEGLELHHATLVAAPGGGIALVTNPVALTVTR